MHCYIVLGCIDWFAQLLLGETSCAHLALLPHVERRVVSWLDWVPLDNSFNRRLDIKTVKCAAA